MIDERPDGLIQRSSQTLEEISTDEIDRHVGLLEMNTVSDLILFEFFIGSDGMRICAKSTYSLAQEVKMILCPIGFAVSVS